MIKKKKPKMPKRVRSVFDGRWVDVFFDDISPERYYCSCTLVDSTGEIFYVMHSEVSKLQSVPYFVPVNVPQRMRIVAPQPVPPASKDLFHPTLPLKFGDKE